MCKRSESKGNARCQGQSRGRLAQERQSSGRGQWQRRLKRTETVEGPERQAKEFCSWLAGRGLLGFFEQRVT